MDLSSLSNLSGMEKLELDEVIVKDLTNLELMEKDDEIFSSFWGHRDLTMPIDRLKPLSPMTRKRSKNTFRTLGRKKTRNHLLKTGVTLPRRKRLSAKRKTVQDSTLTKSSFKEVSDIDKSTDLSPSQQFRFKETDTEISFRESVRSNVSVTSTPVLSVPPPVFFKKEPRKLDTYNGGSGRSIISFDEIENKLHKAKSRSQPVQGSRSFVEVEDAVKTRHLSEPVKDKDEIDDEI